MKKYRHIKTGIIGTEGTDGCLHYKQDRYEPSLGHMVIGNGSIPMVFVKDSDDWEEHVRYVLMHMIVSGKHTFTLYPDNQVESLIKNGWEKVDMVDVGKIVERLCN